jgi:hypothetical protein
MHNYPRRAPKRGARRLRRRLEVLDTRLLLAADLAFASPEAVLASPGIDVVVAADFDGDGRDDLAVGGSGRTTAERGVSVFLAHEVGPFIAHDRRLINQQVSDLAVADLDGDGDLDLFATASLPAMGAVLLNDGEGRFTEVASYFLGSIGASDTRIAAGDLDQDGDSDIALSMAGADSQQQIA